MESYRILVLAAGKGTRMKSDLPKVLHKLGDKTLIEWVIDTALATDANLIVPIIGYKGKDVENFLKDKYKRFLDRIKFAWQKEQLGTGHAILCAKEYIENFEGNIVILSGDVPLISKDTIIQLNQILENNNASCVVATSVVDDPKNYGRIVRDEFGNIKRIVEAKDATLEELMIKEINTGIYCYKSKDLLDALHKISNDNAQNEYYLTDTISILIKENKKVYPYKINNKLEYQGINTIEELKALEQYILHERK